MHFLSPLFFRNLRLRHDIRMFFKIARVAELLLYIKELSVSVLNSLAVCSFKLAEKIPVVI